MQQSEASDITITTGSLTDLKELQQLFVDTVITICKADYTSEQLKAWTSGIGNTERWQHIVTEQFLLVAKINGKIVGFASLDHGDYLDMFYVHKDYQGQGIASMLYLKIQEEAYRQGKSYIYSNVSKTAKPFFLGKGFIAETEQTVIRHDVALTNFKMKKELH